MQHEEVLLETKRFRVVRSVRTSPSGRQHVRETVEHPGSVTVLPLLDEATVCLIRNFRPSVNRTLIELPAGTLEGDEDPLKAAHRELAEETGYRAATMELLASFFLSPGILNERMHLYLASGLTAGEMHLDEGEEIERVEMPLAGALEMALAGQIEDAKTLAGLFFYDAWRREARRR